MTRKDFLSYGVKGLGGLLAAFGLAKCSSYTSPSTPTPGGTFTSTTSNGHTHTFTLTQSDVQSPPAAGISGTTSSVGHTHTFAMTQAQLQQVNGGATVTITSGSTDASGGPHTHDFAIKKWF
jgi:hypothetical protein